MRDYELVFIISPEVAEENVPAIVEKVQQFIAGRGGEVTGVNHWGRRKLAYPIRRFTEGNYVLNLIKMDPKLTAELEANLLTSEDILRHLLVRVDSK
ncbi:MAG: 30S ribosomal protein S6 [Chloroflexi bacterium]|nr:30S ribosomal protein S6 [Chloroflexota bacterium]